MVFSRSLLIGAIFGAAVTGCTTRPENIQARYVSPHAYRTWECADLIEEARRIEAELARLTEVQQTNADVDTGVTMASTATVIAGFAAAVPTFGLSLLLVPAGLGMNAGLATTTDRRDEIGRLRGELEAVRMSRTQRLCPASHEATQAS